MVDEPSVIPIILGPEAVFLIKGERCILIDAGMPGRIDAILKKIDSEGIRLRDISLIVITHSHIDHFGSAKVMKEKTGAKVSIHSLAADLLRRGKNEDIVPIGPLGRFFRTLISAMPSAAGDSLAVEPELILSGEMPLEEYGVKGKVLSTPGHTPGSISVLLDSGEAIIGDMIRGGFFSKNIPEIPFFATDVNQLKESVSLVMSHKPKVIFASHGGPFTPEAIRKKFAIT